MPRLGRCAFKFGLDVHSAGVNVEIPRLPSSARTAIARAGCESGPPSSTLPLKRIGPHRSPLEVHVQREPSAPAARARHLRPAHARS